MQLRPTKPVVGTLVGAALMLATAGIAAAVSGGGYDSSQQDCSPDASAFNQPDMYTQPGCHNFAINVEDGSGRTRYAELGLDQLPIDSAQPGTPTPLSIGYPGNANSVHAGCAAANTNGTGGGLGKGCGDNPGGLGLSSTFDLQNPSQPLTVTPDSGTPDVAALLANISGNGLRFYLGTDDNLDAGEHDGVDSKQGTVGSVNGPSDGGGIGVYLLPQDAAQAPTAYNPLAIAGAYMGFCADGFCTETTTSRQTLYHGCSTDPASPVYRPTCTPTDSRDVYNYDGKQWDPYNCSSGDSKSEAACKSQPNGQPNMDGYRAAEAHNVYAEPGFQFYEDPDPQASPLDPLYEAGVTPQPNDYPLPAVYAGTCGAVVGGGPVAQAPASPATNRSGQVAVTPTGC